MFLIIYVKSIVLKERLVILKDYINVNGYAIWKLIGFFGGGKHHIGWLWFAGAGNGVSVVGIKTFKYEDSL